MQQRASAASAAIMLNELVKDTGEVGHVVCGWDGWSSWVAISMKKRMGMSLTGRERERERQRGGGRKRGREGGTRVLKYT